MNLRPLSLKLPAPLTLEIIVGVLVHGTMLQLKANEEVTTMAAQKPAPVHLTATGLATLKAELITLTKEKRPAMAKRLHFAIKQGDLSENADYITAKEEQGFLEGRIRELEYKIQHAQLIAENTRKDGRIHLGSQVVIQEKGTEIAETYQLVGATEADPQQGKISNESPLGRALLDKKVGETVVVSAPAGNLFFSITDID